LIWDAKGMLKVFLIIFLKKLKEENKDTSMYILFSLHMFKTYQTNYNIISRFEIYIPWSDIALSGHHVFFLYVKLKYIHTYIIHR
jgi:hypothetical protein